MNILVASQCARSSLFNYIRVTAGVTINSKICSSRLIKFFSNSSGKTEKPYYITTPIFYVNSAPHVGHLYTMVIADILKRWQVLNGNTAILCTGTDEHGIKVQQAAAQAGRPLQEFCDTNSGIFNALARRGNISNDHFIRTTDPAHQDAVQYFWSVLKERDLIYESKHEGWYCVSDETFYPEIAIEKRRDPYTGRAFMASQETGKEVEWTSERNYHFRLSKFKEPLLEFYQENPKFILPKQRMDDVVAAVSSGLDDLSVSRPIGRLSWGVRVPDDESQTIYVWLDALVNYLTKAKYPWPPEKYSSGGWPADVHVIGKDIIRFHGIYWPAFLMAAGLQPPKQILTHAHWTLANKKMSKSTGNTVNPTYALDRFGADVIRYYLAYDGGILNDTDYGNLHIVERYKKGLQGGLGNLLFRLTRCSSWNVKGCIKNYEHKNGFPKQLEATVGFAQALIDLPNQVHSKMDQLDIRNALHLIMNVVHKVGKFQYPVIPNLTDQQTNYYFQQTQPWNLTKSHVGLGEVSKSLTTCRPIWEIIYHCAEALRITGILLQPYMPGKATELLDMLCVDTEKRSFIFARLGADFDYGNVAPTSRDNILFPMLAVEN